MQFTNKITAVSNSYNEFGERNSREEHEIKCRVLSHRLRKKGDIFGTSEDKQEDLHIIVPYRKFHPYDAIFHDKTMTFFYEGVQYDVSYISNIKNFAGSNRYFEVAMRQTYV